MSKVRYIIKIRIRKKIIWIDIFYLINKDKALKNFSGPYLYVFLKGEIIKYRPFLFLRQRVSHPAALFVPAVLLSDFS